MGSSPSQSTLAGDRLATTRIRHHQLRWSGTRNAAPLCTGIGALTHSFVRGRGAHLHHHKPVRRRDEQAANAGARRQQPGRGDQGAGSTAWVLQAQGVRACKRPPGEQRRPHRCSGGGPQRTAARRGAEPAVPAGCGCCCLWRAAAAGCPGGRRPRQHCRPHPRADGAQRRGVLHLQAAGGQVRCGLQCETACCICVRGRWGEAPGPCRRPTQASPPPDPPLHPTTLPSLVGERGAHM